MVKGMRLTSISPGWSLLKTRPEVSRSFIQPHAVDPAEYWGGSVPAFQRWKTIGSTGALHQNRLTPKPGVALTD